MVINRLSRKGWLGLGPQLAGVKPAQLVLAIACHCVPGPNVGVVGVRTWVGWGARDRRQRWMITSSPPRAFTFSLRRPVEQAAFATAGARRGALAGLATLAGVERGWGARAGRPAMGGSAAARAPPGRTHAFPGTLKPRGAAAIFA